MGILKVGVGAAQGVLADSWREYFYCDAMDVDVLAKKGEQRQSKRGFNTKKSENIISNGSIIVINEGQCMMIVEQGKVVEVCAEAGEFLYDSATEPSLFYGDLKESIRESFRQFGKRVGFGGDPAGDQRIYYFNTKEILGNKYGTSNPVPFRVVDTNIGLDIDIAIRCHGEYAYHIIDPILFYKNICGNITDTYTRDSMESQLKSEMLTALQPAFGKLSAMGIRYSALPAHTMELSQALNEVLAEKWGGRYGIEITSIGVSSVKASDEDEAMIKEKCNAPQSLHGGGASGQCTGRSHAGGSGKPQCRSRDGFCRDESGKSVRRHECRAALSNGGAATASDTGTHSDRLGLQLWRSREYGEFLYGMWCEKAGGKCLDLCMRQP